MSSNDLKNNLQSVHQELDTGNQALVELSELQDKISFGNVYSLSDQEVKTGGLFVFDVAENLRNVQFPVHGDTTFTQIRVTKPGRYEIIYTVNIAPNRQTTNIVLPGGGVEQPAILVTNRTTGTQYVKTNSISARFDDSTTLPGQCIIGLNTVAPYNNDTIQLINIGGLLSANARFFRGFIPVPPVAGVVGTNAVIPTPFPNLPPMPSVSISLNRVGDLVPTLVFLNQPVRTRKRHCIADAEGNPLQVALTDGADNIITSFNGRVTLHLNTNPTHDKLDGTVCVHAKAGIATFKCVWLDRIGNGYSLKACTPGYPHAYTMLFNVVKLHLDWDCFPVDTTVYEILEGGNCQRKQAGLTSNAASGNGVGVQIFDNNGTQWVHQNVPIEFFISKFPQGGTNVFNGSKQKIIVKTDNLGFAGLDASINVAGNGYKITALGDDIESVVSPPFDVIIPNLVVLVQPPTTVAHNTTMSPPIQVIFQDNNNNTITTGPYATANVVVGLSPNTANLNGTLIRQAVAGVASFNDLSISAAGSYQLVFTALGAVSVTSNPISVT